MAKLEQGSNNKAEAQRLFDLLMECPTDMFENSLTQLRLFIDAIPHSAHTGYLNFHNLGQSYYTSAPLALLFNMPQVYDFIMDKRNIKAKPDADSGRDPVEWKKKKHTLRF
jgi:hypothetical protein